MKSQNALSLSFLDVMTCSLGAVLLLFFILAAIKERMEFRETSMSVVKQGYAHSALVIVAYSEDGEPLFPMLTEASDEQSMWKVNGATIGTDVYVNAGGNFAVLYAFKPLPPGTQVWLGPVRDEARFHVQIVRQGQRKLATPDTVHRAVPISPDGLRQLWPPPRELSTIDTSTASQRDTAP